MGHKKPCNFSPGLSECLISELAIVCEKPKPCREATCVGTWSAVPSESSLGHPSPGTRHMSKEALLEVNSLGTAVLVPGCLSYFPD